ELSLASNRAEFEAALNAQQADVVLADYLVPTYDGLQALKAVRARYPETPFLIVSGTMGEQAAIDSLRCGATDYVFKHWHERLVPANLRAVHEAEERAERRRVETELTRREKYFRTLTENALDVVTSLNQQGQFLYNSPSVERVLGYEAKALVGQSLFGFL